MDRITGTDVLSWNLETRYEMPREEADQIAADWNNEAAQTQVTAEQVAEWGDEASWYEMPARDLQLIADHYNASVYEQLIRVRPEDICQADKNFSDRYMNSDRYLEPLSTESAQRLAA